MAIKTMYIVLVLIGIVGAVAITSDFFGSNTSEGLTWQCYNSDHVEISCSTGQPLSAVGGVPGIDSLIFTLSATNTGDIPLTCSVISASPTSFSVAMPVTAKIVEVGGQASWVSDFVDMGPLEALTQPVSFSATVRCKYKDGVETVTISPDINKSVDLTITSDEINAGFDVDFTPPDLGEVVCGDGICQIPIEDIISCPSDCSV